MERRYDHSPKAARPVLRRALACVRYWYHHLLWLDCGPSAAGVAAPELDAKQDHAPVKPVIQWVRMHDGPGHDYSTGYWACRHRKGNAYRSGVGRTPQEAYIMWALMNPRH